MNNSNDIYGLKPNFKNENLTQQRRLETICEEFKEGFEFIKQFSKSVTFFGASRVKEGSPIYEKARRLAGRIAKELNYAVVTGGGPGIMEAGNRGAQEACGSSYGMLCGDTYGLTIDLGDMQRKNSYVTNSIGFKHFFVRKLMLSFGTEAYIFFPGGYGTLDEFFEIVTLIQTKRKPPVPIVCVGAEFWNKLHDFMQEQMFNKFGAIEEDDLKIYKITDDEDEIINIIKSAPIRD